jgi:release factor glutamine methyltransferase
VTTLAALVARARDRLLAGGVPAEEASGDAEVLARHALDWDLTRYTLSRGQPPPADFAERYDPLIARRLKREPVSQIVGHREFWGLDFEVTRDVLTPRPETELVVQAALDIARTGHPSSAPVIVDIGTGSGCIAIALTTELPDSRFIASDASLAALTVARRNAVRHGVADRIAFLHTALIPPENDFEIVVCNPPYIPLAQRDALPPEVGEYEPEVALFGGDDGLEFYRSLLHWQTATALVERGWLIVEVGYDQADAVKALADPLDWEPGGSYHDLQGIERVLTFRARHRFLETIEDTDGEDE